MVQRNGARGLSQRVINFRVSSSKYSTRRLASMQGLSAASRAMPISSGMPHLRSFFASCQILFYDHPELDYQHQSVRRNPYFGEIERSQLGLIGARRLLQQLARLVANLDLQILRDALRQRRADAADVIGIPRGGDLHIFQP